LDKKKLIKEKKEKPQNTKCHLCEDINGDIEHQECTYKQKMGFMEISELCAIGTNRKRQKVPKYLMPPTLRRPPVVLKNWTDY